MPKLAEVAGAVIKMYYLDHDPPHVHAVHGGGVIKIDLATCEVVRVRGARPKARTERLILKWAQQHAHELMLAFGDVQAGLEPRNMERS